MDAKLTKLIKRKTIHALNEGVSKAPFPGGWLVGNVQVKAGKIKDRKVSLKIEICDRKGNVLVYFGPQLLAEGDILRLAKIEVRQRVTIE